MDQLSSSKRPRRDSPPAHTRLPSPPPNSDLYLQAQEADLIYGHDDLAAQVEGREGVVPGGRMLRWGGQEPEGEDVWIDRYDALNLLTTSPSPRPASPRSDSGFSDLPSDSEEHFYFDEGERAEIGRRKKRRAMEEGREARIRAMEAERGVLEEEKEVGVSAAAVRVLALGLCEGLTPSETQTALMRKLSATLSVAADPSLLEIRILANHGNDPRFGFLRRGGKWREVWEAIRKEGKVEKVVAATGSGGFGLVAYGSDSEGEEEGTTEEALEEVSADLDHLAEKETLIPPLETEEERAKKEAKAEKAREWARKRREAREGVGVPL